MTVALPSSCTPYALPESGSLSSSEEAVSCGVSASALPFSSAASGAVSGSASEGAASGADSFSASGAASGSAEGVSDVAVPGSPAVAAWALNEESPSAPRGMAGPEAAVSTGCSSAEDFS